MESLQASRAGMTSSGTWDLGQGARRMEQWQEGSKCGVFICSDRLDLCKSCVDMMPPASVGRIEVEAFAGKGALSAALTAKGFTGCGAWRRPVDAAA